MLSSKVRLELQEIARKISVREEVSFSERVLIHKWADANRTVYDMLRKAKRMAFQEENPSQTDQFLDALNLGEPDPNEHKTHFDDPEDFGNFFKAPSWMRRD